MEISLIPIIKEKGTKAEEVEFLKVLDSAFNRDKAETINLLNQKHLKIICMKSADEKIRICVNTVDYWLGGRDKEEDDRLSSSKPYLQISWLDKRGRFPIGFQVRYTPTKDGKTEVLLRPIRDSQVRNWEIGDTIEENCFGLFENKHPSMQDLLDLIDVLKNGKHDSELQSSTLKWQRQWHGEAKDGGMEIV